MSLYFPYDFCLYDGMTALESFAIRFVPFFVTISIISVLLITRRLVHSCGSHISIPNMKVLCVYFVGLFINYDNINSDMGYGFLSYCNTVTSCIHQCHY